MEVDMEQNNINFEFNDFENLEAKIKVIGIGGGGGNTVNTMIAEGVEKVEFIAANTDAKALQTSKAEVKLQIGSKLTKGLGAGANPEIGRNAAIEDADKIREVLTDGDMVFITAGMGGGTGTGAAPVIAELSKELGMLTVGVITKPFDFEGRRRMRQAESGIEELKKHVDALIVIPNQRILSICSKNLSLKDSFKIVDQVLVNAVRGISDLIATPAYINLDFADVRTVMSDTGLALMGTGIGIGENRAVDAATQAISSPLLEDVSIEGARGVIINITGSSDITAMEIHEACNMIYEAAHEDANIIFGVKFDDALEDELKITIIATGFSKIEQGFGKKTISLNKNKGEDRREKRRKRSVNGGIFEDDFDEDILDIPTFIRRKPD
jgi:cell division protein FtsZ